MSDETKPTKARSARTTAGATSTRRSTAGAATKAKAGSAAKGGGATVTSRGAYSPPTYSGLRQRYHDDVVPALRREFSYPNPMHLHGHFFEVVNGHTGSHPLKHTVNVLPGGKVSFDLTADAPGDWAFHCHLLMHMHAGMMRVVTVRPLDGDPA